MGLYLGMQGNNAGSEITGQHADENYAREIQQLFSIGLNREWPDGSYILNSQNNLVPTYNQNVIMGVASVFTGWNYYQQANQTGERPVAVQLVPPLPTMHQSHGARADPSRTGHQTLLLDNVMLPQAWGNQANSTYTNFDSYCLAQDLESATLNCIYNNPNVAPFICRELIQRLVTSNPSRDYVYRVAQVFNNDGTGVRGNLAASGPSDSAGL